jgi:hypothetical protein
MKALFLDVVAKAKKRYSFRIENFTVRGNHFHLIIQPGKTFDYIDDNQVKAGLSAFCGDWVFGGLFFGRKGIRGIYIP